MENGFCPRAYEKTPNKDYVLWNVRGKPYCRECMNNFHYLRVMFWSEHEHEVEEHDWTLRENTKRDDEFDDDHDDEYYERNEDAAACRVREDEFLVQLYRFTPDIDAPNADIRFIGVGERDPNLGEGGGLLEALLGNASGSFGDFSKDEDEESTD